MSKFHLILKDHSSYYEKFADGTLKSIQDEIPFEIPKGWEWASLGQITSPNSLNDGDWILSKNMTLLEEIKIVQLGHIGYGEYKNKSYKYISEETFIELNCTEIEKDYILINRLLGDVMYTCKLPEIKGKKITSVDVCWIMPSESKYNSDYLLYLLMSPYFQEKVFKLATGTTRLRISKGNLIKIIIPFPPINYQNKMVEKIKELFNIIDSIKQNKESLELIKKKVNVKSLNLALQGKLVPQDPKDEPASVLLEKIKEEKEKLILEGKIKRNKKESTILRRGESYYELLDGEEKDITDEIPYSIPSNWEWTRLSSLILPQKKIKPELNFSYIDISSIDNINHIIKESKYIQDKIPVRATNLLEKNDIVFSLVRPYLKNIAIVPQEYHHAIGTSGFFVIKINNNYIKSGYLIKVLTTDSFIDRLTLHMKGDNSPSVTNTDFLEMMIPIPPLKEQEKIIELLNKC
ncbi:hypothetical protein GTN30_10845 [Macrococcoides canis]|uniref:Type I restriction modification DNA specificity domain-containing protein n=1 Tax=Macrococcoides canis TaxID=1855823 RepID=A0AAE7C1C8_9STAP|nr:restriction endonuclease subunit S [Macrococcus canis]QIH79139.1 hypothetical protein GTN30_10845 [Macrococcus canis]